RVGRVRVAEFRLRVAVAVAVLLLANLPREEPVAGRPQGALCELVAEAAPLVVRRHDPLALLCGAGELVVFLVGRRVDPQVGLGRDHLGEPL
ncbi:hypothetical protein DF186_15555, partial [Enterococcus hirae]